MATNAAGLNVSGSANPNWKGGKLAKNCASCGVSYSVIVSRASSRFCSLACVGISQRGAARISPELLKVTEKACEVCGKQYQVPSAHQRRHHCCSRPCSFKRRALMQAGDRNHNWAGGVSRLPYPWNFRMISKAIIHRDGGKCQNPTCTGADKRLTTHHINYDKQDCREANLICLCSACNSKANYRRAEWTAIYQAMMARKIKVTT